MRVTYPKKYINLRKELSADELLFGKVTIPEMFTEDSAEFHREVADLLIDQSIQKLLIMAPRKHAKSSIVACIHVLHHLLFFKGPKLIVLSSRTLPHAKRLLGTLKDIFEHSVTFRKIFGYWGRFNAQRWAEDQIILKDGTLIIALGTGQMVVGLKQVHQRPTLIILDDPEDMENTKTETALRHNIRWLLKSLLPTLDTKRGRIVVIGTPQCEGCMILKLFDLPGWVSKKYEAVLDWDEHEVLWPQGCSWDFLMAEKLDAEKAGEASIWYSEYMCTIVSGEEQLFKPEYNRYYRGWVTSSPSGKAFIHITHRAHKKEDLDKGELVKEEVIPVYLFMGVDPASSTSHRADHSVNFVIAVDADWVIYILPYYHKRVPPTEHARAIIEMYEQYYPLRTTPEATGYQEALRDILRKFSHLWSKNKKRLYIPGLESKVLPKEKKTKRHKTAMHIHFYQRHVWFLEGMEALESELSMWREDKTLVDDLMDGFYLALLKVVLPTHEYIGEEKSTSRLVVRGDFEDDFEEDWTMA